VLIGFSGGTMKTFFRQFREKFSHFVHDGLPRRQRAANLRRMNADDQLQVRPLRKIPDALRDPLDHVRESIAG